MGEFAAPVEDEEEAAKELFVEEDLHGIRTTSPAVGETEEDAAEVTEKDAAEARREHTTSNRKCGPGKQEKKTKQRNTKQEMKTKRAILTAPQPCGEPPVQPPVQPPGRPPVLQGGENATRRRHKMDEKENKQPGGTRHGRIEN